MQNMNITGHGIEITEALNSHVHAKMQPLDKFFDKITNLHVILKIESNEQIAEADLHLAGGRGNLFAKAKTNDMYTSVNELAKKMAAQLRKYHDKVKSHDVDEGLA